MLDRLRSENKPDISPWPETIDVEEDIAGSTLISSRSSSRTHVFSSAPWPLAQYVSTSATPLTVTMRSFGSILLEAEQSDSILSITTVPYKADKVIYRSWQKTLKNTKWRKSISSNTHNSLFMRI